MPKKNVANGFSKTYSYNGNKIVQSSDKDEKTVYTYTGDLITKVVSVYKTHTETREYSYENNRLKNGSLYYS